MSIFKKSFAALFGNIMQFYDFTIYAFLTPYISITFFNFDNAFLSYLFVFIVFSIGYLSRPLGALLFGFIGDKRGRSRSLSKTIILITSSTFLIGLIPSQEIIGIFAPVFLVILRLLQGLAVSGEEGGAVVLLFEKNKFANNGLIGSFVLSSVLMGVILGTVVCFLTTKLILNGYIGEWGWRLPFIASLPLGVIAIIFRYYINDINIFNLANKNNLTVENPTTVLFKNYLWEILYGISIVSLYSVTTSLLIVHMPYYLNIKIGLAHDLCLLVTFISISTIIVLTPIISVLFKKYEYERLHFFTLMLLIVSSPILFSLLTTKDNVSISILLFYSVMIIIVSLISTTVFPILVNIYPFCVRYSGVSLSFNLSITIFSSTTPLFLVFLENTFSYAYIPGLYISVLSLITVLINKKIKKNRLINFDNKKEKIILFGIE